MHRNTTESNSNTYLSIIQDWGRYTFDDNACILKTSATLPNSYSRTTCATIG